LKIAASTGIARLTDEQKEIVESSDSAITVTAYAGTGKTSTLKALAAKWPKERILYLAFNRALADESRLAFGSLPNVEVRTFHGLAWKSVGKRFNSFSNPRSLDVLPYVEGVVGKAANFEASRVALDAFNAWLISDNKTLDGFFKGYSKTIALRLRELAVPGKAALRPSRLKPVLGKIWADCQSGRFPMPHNGYLKLFQLSKREDMGGFDRILVDEAQDLNDCMIDIINSNNAKKVLVGDPYQQIYSFNGAVNALAKGKVDGAKSYYLTQSFRCPDFVASLANQYLKLLGAPKDFKGLPKPPARPGGAGELIIARTNAGLFDFVASALNSKPSLFFCFNGGFDGYEFENIVDVVHLLRKSLDKVQNRFMRRFKSFDELRRYADEAGELALNARIAIARKHFSRAEEIYDSMRSRQGSEERADYVTTTAHKIKGREYEKVTLLNDFVSIQEAMQAAGAIKKSLAETGQRKGEPPRIFLEEFRLIYVSVTRSFKRLAIPAEYTATDDQILEFSRLAKDGFVELLD
jgi:superfamily I DNA/RNA helicase